MTRAAQRLRNHRIVERVKTMQNRNIPKVAREFGLSRRAVDRILQINAQKEAQPNA